MTNAIISRGVLKYSGGQDYIKQVTIVLVTDEVIGITPFKDKFYHADATPGQNGYYDPAASHINAQGLYSQVIIRGSTWQDIDDIVTDLTDELKTKFQNLRDAQDLGSAPSEQTIDLNLP